MSLLPSLRNFSSGMPELVLLECRTVEEKLEEVKQQTSETKEKGKPSQRSVKRNSTNFKPTLSVFGVRSKQGDVMTISVKRMAFIPVT